MAARASSGRFSSTYATLSPACARPSFGSSVSAALNERAASIQTYACRQREALVVERLCVFGLSWRCRRARSRCPCGARSGVAAISSGIGGSRCAACCAAAAPAEAQREKTQRDAQTIPHLCAPFVSFVTFVSFASPEAQELPPELEEAALEHVGRPQPLARGRGRVGRGHRVRPAAVEDVVDVEVEAQLSIRRSRTACRSACRADAGCRRRRAGPRE